MKTKDIIILIVAVVVLAGLAFYIGLKQGEKSGYTKGKEDTEKSYKELIEKSTGPLVNPMENLPTTNPFEGVKVNPFEGGYQNPFK